MLSRYWQAKPLCIKVTWFSKTAHTCTYAYMSAETADIPLSVNHLTQGCYIMYNVMCLMYYISCYMMFSTKRYDHLVFTYRLISTLMLPQHCCTVCITSIIRRVLCFIRIHWNYEILFHKEIILWDKKSGWSKSVLSQMKISGCPALCFEKKISATSLYGLNWPHNWSI